EGRPARGGARPRGAIALAGRDAGGQGMTRRRLVFWQQVASIHQSAMLRALASRDDLEVVLVVDRDVPAWRRASGWFDLDLGRVNVVHHEDASSTRALTSSTGVDVHIFSGLRAPPLRRAFRRARGGDAK